MNHQVYVYLYEPRGWISKMIAWYTRGQFSHAAISIDGYMYESTSKTGVIKRRVTEEKDATIFQINTKLVPDFNDIALSNMIHFARKQVGKKYDSSMVAGFVTRKSQESRKSKGKWFCSELVFSILQKAGIDLFNYTEPFEVSPEMMSRSPFLIKKDNVQKMIDWPEKV